MMRAHGRINLVSWVLLVAAAAGVYWLVFFAPVYLDHFDIEEAVVGSYNEAGLVTDEMIQNRIIDTGKRIGQHRVVDEQGNVTVEPGLGLLPEQIIVVRDETAKTISIRVEYDREIVLKPLKHTRRVRLVSFKEGPVIGTRGSH